MTAERKRRPLAPGGTWSRLYRDQAVRAALDAIASSAMTIDMMRVDIMMRFGADRTPSRSAIGRYIRAVRIARNIDFGRRPR